MLQRFQPLTPEEAKEISQHIKSRYKDFSKPVAAFFDDIAFYGYPWYVFSEMGIPSTYFHRANEINKLMREIPHWNKVFKAGCHIIQETEKRKVKFVLRKGWCATGFHISDYTCKDHFPHCDFEGLIPYPEKMFDVKAKAYSLCCCIEMPYKGGNLKVWQKTTTGEFAHTLDEELKSPEMPVPDLVEYHPGTAVIFDSLFPHQVLAQTIKGDALRIVGVFHYCKISADTYEYWF